MWSPLAAGLLSGKHRRGAGAPEGSRQAEGWNEPPIRDMERLWAIVDTLLDIGEAHQVEAAQIALAWLLTRPAVASLVVGGRETSQFERNFRAVDMVLSEGDLTRLNDVSRLPLVYPCWNQHNFVRPRFSPADQALHADCPDHHYGGEDPLV